MIPVRFIPVFIGIIGFGTSLNDKCSNVVRNGNFEEGTKDWKFIGQNTGLLLISSDRIPRPKSKQPIPKQQEQKENERDSSIHHGSALSTAQRDQWYHGMSQELQIDCLTQNQYYEVSMNVMILDYAGKPVICDPFQYHFDPSTSTTCPTLALQLESKDNQLKSIPIGNPIGPWNPTEWNEVYGIFQATPFFFQQKRVEMYVTNAPVGHNEVIDNVIIKPISTSTVGLRTCSMELVKNGDAETKDARFWYLKGDASTYGTLEIILTSTPGSSNKSNNDSKEPFTNHAFYHYGNRKNKWNGMWQKLDQDCLGIGSKWKISLYIKILNKKREEIWCDTKKRACPEITFESITIRGTVTENLRNLIKKPWENLQNLVTKPWVQGEWNRFETEFTMTEAHKKLDETWFYVSNIEPGHGYIIDNISMVPIMY